MKRPMAVFALVLILTGCATYSLVKPQRTAIGDLYTVDPQVPWSKISKGKIEVWTVDGPSLESIRFVKGLEDGEVLFEGKNEEKRPKFRKHMTPTEIMEFVVDSVALAGGQKIGSTDLRPENFGKVQGFRFEISFLSKEGLEEEGLVYGATVGEKLYLIMYTGAKAYYFPKYKDHVERIIKSVEIQKPET